MLFFASSFAFMSALLGGGGGFNVSYTLFSILFIVSRLTSASVGSLDFFLVSESSASFPSFPFLGSLSSCFSSSFILSLRACFAYLRMAFFSAFNPLI